MSSDGERPAGVEPRNRADRPAVGGPPIVPWQAGTTAVPDYAGMRRAIREVLDADDLSAALEAVEPMDE